MWQQCAQLAHVHIVFSTVKTKATAPSSYIYTAQATTVNSSDTQVHNYPGFLSQRSLLHTKGITTQALKSQRANEIHSNYHGTVITLL